MNKKLILLMAVLATLSLILVACKKESDAPLGETTAQTTTEAITEAVTEAPTVEATEASTDEATEAVTDTATEAPTAEATEASTEDVTDAATEEDTVASTEASTDESTDEATTEEATEPPVPAAKYTVNWVVNGEVVATGATDDENEEAGKPADPTREATTEVTYTFDTWVKTVEDTTITYTARFLEAPTKHTVTFVANGTTVKTEEVEYGASATAPHAPAVEGQWFAGWDGEYTSIRSSVTITAIYKDNGQLNHVSNDELRIQGGSANGGAAFTPGQFDAWNGFLTLEAGSFESLYDWGWAAFKSEFFIYGYIINNGDPIWSESYTVPADSQAVQDAISAFGPDGSRFGGSLSAAALSLGENHVKFLVKLDGDVVAVIREYTVIIIDPSIGSPDEPGAHEHNYTALVTAPTCKKGGYTTFVCLCGDSYIGNETPVRGHEFHADTCIGCGGVLPTYTAWNADKSIVTHISFDQLYVGPTANDGNAFTPGKESEWNKVAVIDRSVSQLYFWGWIGYKGEFSQFGYQIDCDAPVFDASYAVAAEEEVVNAAAGTGATGVSRMRICMNTAGLTAGVHTVNALYKNADGEIVRLSYFKILIVDDNGAQATDYYSASDLVAMGATNATVTAGDGYAHVVSNDGVGGKNDPKITLTSDGFSDFVVIKYKTNAESYGLNYDGYFLLNGNKFIGNRKNSDNWFEYYTDGEWHYLVLDLRKNKTNDSAEANTDVNNGAALTTAEYVLFDYAGNKSGKKSADEFIDIAYVAFY